jgi:HD-GYP domain-containing protein (c-di-GMP phosphodiesterase class II)
MAEVGALLAFIERLETFRDPSAPKHAQSVSRLVVQVAIKNKLDIDIEELGWAATLHDVGKLLLSQDLLAQTGRLTREEFEIIKQHTTLGFELVSPLKLGKLIDDGVLFHHENYDGSGYPHGLAGEDIPVAARIIRIADMYDALITTRPYRLGYSRQHALQIMLEHQHCFDPHLFEVFLNALALQIDIQFSDGTSRYSGSDFDLEHG